MKTTKIRPWTWIALTIAFVVGMVGIVVYSFYITVSVTVPNAYAVWVTAELIIQHMETHDGDWPRGWDDIQPYYIPGTTIESPSGFDNLKRRVEVDWTVDIPTLRQSFPSYSDDLRVIWLRDRRDDQWSDADPNELIFKYLEDGYRDPAPGYSNRVDEPQRSATDFVTDSDEH